MQSFKHVASIEYKPTFRTQKVCGMFDLPVGNKIEKEWDIKLDLDKKEWKIGLIIGASGTGKTTMCKEIFGEENYHKGFKWEQSSLLDDFDESLEINEIVNALSHVGFSSPPHWILPYNVLSNGQKFRCEIARCLLEHPGDILVFDEFTSVVDRNVAKMGSLAVSKHIRKNDKQFVAVTCHADVEAYLQPDWVLDMSTSEFKWGCLRRPKSELQIFKCNRKAWSMFADYHYLTKDISKAAQVYVGFINNEPVAFASFINLLHPTKRGFNRVHRTVVLPDYQGIGIGQKMNEFLGEESKKNGKKLSITTSHPTLIKSGIKSKKWKLTIKPGHVNKSSAKHPINNTVSSARLSATLEYVG